MLWAKTSFIADFSSFILLVPPILFFGQSKLIAPRRRAHGSLAIGLLALYFAGAFWLTFIDRSYTSIAAFGPVFIWLALFWGISATAFACALIALASIMQIIIDVGADAPNLTYYLANRILEAQMTASLNVFAFIPLAIVVVQRAVLDRDIERERAKSISAARLNRIVLDTISDGVLSLDHDGKVITANKSARRLLAHGNEDGARDTVTSPSLESIPDELCSAFRELRSEGRSVKRSLELHSDNETLRLDSRLEPLLDEGGQPIGVLAVLCDVTQAHEARELTLALENRFQTLYHSTPALLHSIDSAGRLISVSDRWLDVLGYERSEVIGRRSTEFLTAESQELAKDVLRTFREQGYVHDIPYRFVRKDGVEVDMLLSATSERDPSGKIIRSLAVMHEFTEIRRLQRSPFPHEALQTAIFDHVARRSSRRIATATCSPSIRPPSMFSASAARTSPASRSRVSFAHRTSKAT
ncbi:MAG: PAS domain-containing protein [Geminicoccaceae bacterium]